VSTVASARCPGPGTEDHAEVDKLFDTPTPDALAALRAKVFEEPALRP
jgi:hypothetical protein